MPPYGYYPFASSDASVSSAPLVPSRHLLISKMSRALSRDSTNPPRHQTFSTAPTTMIPGHFSTFPYGCYSTGPDCGGVVSVEDAHSGIGYHTAAGWPTQTTAAMKSTTSTHTNHKEAALEAAAVSPIQFGNGTGTAFNFAFHMPSTAVGSVYPAPRVGNHGAGQSRIVPSLPAIDTSTVSTTSIGTPTSTCPGLQQGQGRTFTPIAPHPAGKHGFDDADGLSSSSSSSVSSSDRPSAKRQRRASPPPMTSADLSDEDRLLIKLKDDDGLAWKEIAARFQTDLGKTFQVPALQMRLKRLRERMRTWTESDVTALQLSVAFWDKHKFEIIADKMAEFGARDKWTARQCARKWQSLVEADETGQLMMMTIGHHGHYQFPQQQQHHQQQQLQQQFHHLGANHHQLGSPISGAPTPAFTYAATPETPRYSPIQTVPIAPLV